MNSRNDLHRRDAETQRRRPKGICTASSASLRLCGAILVVAVPAYADDAPPAKPELAKEVEILVTARRETPASASTAAVTRFTEDDFDRLRPTTIGDVLRETPGAYVSPDGPPGQFTRVFLRGAASNQTLALIDGIPQNDATAGGLFDFGDLTMTGVERVEVLRGSYSVLYGSEAIGGVVNVTTRRGRGPLSGYAVARVGTFGERREEVGVSQGDEDADWALAVGDTAASGDRDRERFRAHDVVGRFGAAFGCGLRFEGAARLAESKTESPFDFASSGVLPEDDDIGRRRRSASAGGTLIGDVSEWLTVRATASAFDVNGRFKNGPKDGADARDELISLNTSTDLRGRLEATATLARQSGGGRRDGFGFDVTGGGEHLNQRSLSTSTYPNFGAPGYSQQRADDTTRTNSAFAQANLRLPDFGGDGDAPFARRGVLTAGLRRDDHSVFGDENSPYVGGRIDVLETTLRSSYGEGFRAPKPSELFDAFVGDPNLGPETSRSFDVGAERSFADGALRVGVTWFELRVDDLIAFDDSTFHLANFSRTRTTGFEWEAAADLGQGFEARGTLTIQNPRDLETGDPLANRARRFGSAGVSWSRGDWRVSLDGFFSGANPGQGGEFTAPDGEAREHPGMRRIVDLSASWQATEELEVFAGVRNVLDDEWVATPNSPAGTGIGVYAGARLDF
jgi:vitamin B12 transporter